ncbi:MAG: HD domain-containing protein [Nitrospiraceae bacterium]|nr:HD domain-containing protein [Nitrospiraceae bacterium]
MDKKTADLINSLSQVVSSAKNETELAAAIAGLLTSSLSVQRAMVMLMDQEQRFTLAGVSGVSKEKRLELMASCCNNSCTGFMQHTIYNNTPLTVRTLPHMIAEDMPASSAIISPIFAGGQGVGVIVGLSDSFDANNSEHFLEGISRLAGLGFENLRLNKECIEIQGVLMHKIETLQLINEIGKEMLSNLKTKDIVGAVVQLIRRVIPCDGAMVAFIDEKEFEVVTAWGSALAADSRFKAEDTPFYNVLQIGKPSYQSDITKDFSAYPFMAEWASEKNVFSYMCVPLSFQEKPFGVMVLSSVRAAWFTKDHVQTTEKIATQVSVALQDAKLMEDFEDIFIGTVTTLISAMDSKSKWTKGQTLRVADCAMKFGTVVGLRKDALQRLRIAALLHDVGKINTYEDIVDKKDKLSDEDLQMIKMHPIHSAEILLPLNPLKEIIPIIRNHHERYDGTGYPDGIKGDEINLEARILSIADAYEAMRTDRPYRPGLTAEQAVAELKKGSGKQFDPALINRFVDMVAAHQM